MSAITGLPDLGPANMKVETMSSRRDGYVCLFLRARLVANHSFLLANHSGS